MQLRDLLSEEEQATVKRMIFFCKERGYKPFITINPIQIDFRNERIACLAESVRRLFEDIVPVLDYSMDNEWSDTSLFECTDCLTQIAGEKFTTVVFNDITVSYELSKYKNKFA